MRFYKNNKGWLHFHLYNDNLENEEIHQKKLRKEQHVLEKLFNKTDSLLFFSPNIVGKTFLVDHLFKDMDNIIFIDGSEINTISDLKFMFRCSQFILLHEEKTVIEGEIINIAPNSITLKTDEMESSFTIREKINYEEGDIIQIIDGQIQKIGTSRPKENEDVKTNILSIPKGKLKQKRIISKKISLYDLDRIQPDTFLIDRKIIEWIDRNKAVLQDSLLVIDNAHFLSDKVRNYLGNIKNIPHAPFCLLLSQKNMEIRNILKIEAPDLTKENIFDIIQKRVSFEGITVTPEILSRIQEIYDKKGLKFAMNFLFVLSTHAHLEQKTLTMEDFELLLSVFGHIDLID